MPGPAVNQRVSIIVESFNYSEDGDPATLARSLRAACDVRQQDPANREVLLTDTCGTAVITDLLKGFPEVRHIQATGLGYDEAKRAAFEAATGEYLLYLDGDCVPQPGWLEAHCAALSSGAASATGGFTRYAGGYLASVWTLMDFGFLFPLEQRTLGCYASNNSGFRRAVLQAVPMCGSEMRCNCYAHAQELMRARQPVLLIPEARVRHKTPDFFDERLRQGRDAVAACRVNPALRENGWLALGVFAAPLFYGLAVARDWWRLAGAWRDLELPVWSLPATALLLPVFRLVDLYGTTQALWRGANSAL